MENATLATLKKERYRGSVFASGLMVEFTLDIGQTQMLMARDR